MVVAVGRSAVLSGLDRCRDSQALADLMDPSTELQTSTQNLIKRLQADPGMPARILAHRRTVPAARHGWPSKGR